MAMENSDKRRFLENLNAFAELKEKKLSTAQIEIYWRILKRHPWEDIQRAFDYLFDTSTFFPMPAEFNKAIEGDPESKAAVAWATMVHAIEHYGHGKSVQFRDRAIMGVIQAMGGWFELCTTPGLEYRQKEFARLYAHFSRPGRELPDHLVGLIESTNRLAGFGEPNKNENKGQYKGQVIMVDSVGVRPQLIGYDGREQIEYEK